MQHLLLLITPRKEIEKENEVRHSLCNMILCYLFKRQRLKWLMQLCWTSQGPRDTKPLALGLQLSQIPIGIGPVQKILYCSKIEEYVLLSYARFPICANNILSGRPTGLNVCIGTAQL